MGEARSTYGERRGAYRVLVGKLEVRGHLEDPGVDGRIVFRTFDVGSLTGLIWLRIGIVGGQL